MGMEVARECPRRWMLRSAQKGNFSNLLVYLDQGKPQEVRGRWEMCIGGVGKRVWRVGGCVEARRARVR